MIHPFNILNNITTAGTIHYFTDKVRIGIGIPGSLAADFMDLPVTRTCGSKLKFHKSRNKLRKQIDVS